MDVKRLTRGQVVGDLSENVEGEAVEAGFTAVLSRCSATEVARKRSQKCGDEAVPILSGEALVEACTARDRVKTIYLSSLNFEGHTGISMWVSAMGVLVAHDES